MTSTAIIKPDTGRWSRVPLEELENPRKRGPLMVYQDHWWALDDQDNVLFFKGKSYSPQCNVNRQLVERHAAASDYGFARAVLVPWAYVSFNISDYA